VDAPLTEEAKRHASLTGFSEEKKSSPILARKLISHVAFMKSFQRTKLKIGDSRNVNDWHGRGGIVRRRWCHSSWGIRTSQRRWRESRFSDVIKVLVHSSRGVIDGAVSDSGAIVHIAPLAGTQQAHLFQVRAPLIASGYGTINSFERSLEASVIGPFPSR
jgi:hypothetical protein